MNEPKYASDKVYFPPGEYLRDIMLDDYAEKLGISVEEYGNLLAGDLPVNYDLAEKLEKLTDVSADTWLNLQKSYDREKEES